MDYDERAVDASRVCVHCIAADVIIADNELFNLHPDITLLKIKD